MTSLLSSAAANGHPFATVDVLAAARLAVIPGAARPIWDQDVWDLSGIAGAPATMGQHYKVCDFTAIVNPRWRTVAKEFMLARMAPDLPQVAELPGAYRVPLGPASLVSELRHLRMWLNHLTSSGVTSLEQVRQDHADAYLEEMSWTLKEPRRRLAPAALSAFVRAPQSLSYYEGLLSDAYPPGWRPWQGLSPDKVAGFDNPGVARVPPVPDAILRPLLANSLYLVDKIGPPLAIEMAAVRRSEQQQSSTRTLAFTPDRVQQLREAILRWESQGEPAPRAHNPAVNRRLAEGWRPEDPLLHLAWFPITAEVLGAKGSRPSLELLRPELEHWVNTCGIESQWCRSAQLVPSADGGEMVPWALPMDRYTLSSMYHTVVAAGFILTSALTGMRSSELHEIIAGSRVAEERGGGLTRYYIKSRRIKGAAFGGVAESWVVIKDVYRALGVVEALLGKTEGEPLFSGKTGHTGSDRYSLLHAWINGEVGQRLGLQPIPDGPVSARNLRRTLAMMIARRPHGLMATRWHLKHVSVATTEGYAAAPGGHQALFLRDVSIEEDVEHTRLTVAAYADYRRGVMPAGAGARELVKQFQAVDVVLADVDPGQAKLLDDKRVEKLLKAQAKTLHVGPANYCWFTDPKKALCLAMAGTPEAKKPLMGMCDSGRCPQATHHPEHRAVWADHAENTKVVFLGNPRLSKPEQARAQSEYDRSMRIVIEIDKASGSEGSTHGQ